MRQTVLLLNPFSTVRLLQFHDSCCKLREGESKINVFEGAMEKLT